VDILVIDDSKFIRTFLCMNLREAGYEVGEIDPTSLFNILEALHRVLPKFVITDYEMPGCNGESLIRAIREDPVLKDIPVLVISAHAERELIERLSKWRLSGYLLKPIHPQDLLDKVQMLLMEESK